MPVSSEIVFRFVQGLKQVSADLRKMPDSRNSARNYARQLFDSLNSEQVEGAGPYVGLAIHHLTPRELGTLAGEAMRGLGFSPAEIANILKGVIDEFLIYCRNIPRCDIPKGCSASKCSKPVLISLTQRVELLSGNNPTQLHQMQHTWQRDDFLTFMAAGSRALLDPQEDFKGNIQKYTPLAKELLGALTKKSNEGVHIAAAIVSELTEEMLPEDISAFAIQITAGRYYEMSELANLIADLKGYSRQSDDFFNLLRGINPHDHRLPRKPIDLDAMLAKLQRR